MSSRVRKYELGAEKRKKQKRLEQFSLSQKGALDKFVVRESQSSIENQIHLADADGNLGGNTKQCEAQNLENDSKLTRNNDEAQIFVVTQNETQILENDTELNP